MGFDVNGKTVLVTGANRGIGRVIVGEALARGAKKVYAAIREPGGGHSLVSEFGDRLVPLLVDLQDESSIRNAAEQAADVELVINNAGILKTASALDPEAISALQFELDVNVFGLIRMAQAFAPVLKNNGGGALVQLNSVASLKSFADFATYSASKAASYSITQGLRDSLAGQNTQVVSVHPGPIATDMADDAGLGAIAEPPILVAQSIFEALAHDDFHAWPGTMARQVGQAYRPFAEAVIESAMEETPA